MGWTFSTNLVIAWIFIAVLFYAFFPSRKATIITYMGWLFLPCLVEFSLKGLVKIDKEVACALGILLGTIIFDSGRILKLRIKWFDIPMILTCISPFFSSISNGLGAYDGISATRDQFFLWGMHYVIGRMYFSDLASMTELGKGIFYAGLVYVPLCWLEIRVSPQLHYWVYGFMAHRFDQEIRFDGFRPTVFLSHGLVLGMFMCLVSLLAVWFWRSKVIKQVFGIPMSAIVGLVLVTTVFCKSTNAVLLCAVGLFVLHFTSRKWRFVLPLILLIPPAYCGLRGTRNWDGKEMIEISEQLVGRDRADSVQFRLDNEDLLANKALQQPIFGWAGWDRARVYDDYGNDMTVTDGMWIIVLGNYGLFGLGSWLLAMMIPTCVFLLRFSPGAWKHPAVAATAAFAVYFALVGIDSLLNAEAMPFVLAAMGGVCGTLMSAAVTRPRPVSRARSAAVAGFGFNPNFTAPRPEPIPNLIGRLAPGDPDSLLARPQLPGSSAESSATEPKAVPQ